VAATSSPTNGMAWGYAATAAWLDGPGHRRAPPRTLGTCATCLSARLERHSVFGHRRFVWPIRGRTGSADFRDTTGSTST
jgi:hypothetical protein